MIFHARANEAWTPGSTIYYCRYTCLLRNPIDFLCRFLVVHTPLVILSVEGSKSSIALEQKVSLAPIRESFGELIFAKCARWHCKDIVQLFESLLLGFCTGAPVSAISCNDGCAVEIIVMC